MNKSIYVYAFQLVVGDCIILDGRYLTIYDIKGVYLHGRGLAVDVYTQCGCNRILANSTIEVYCYE